MKSIYEHFINPLLVQWENFGLSFFCISVSKIKVTREKKSNPTNLSSDTHNSANPWFRNDDLM